MTSEPSVVEGPDFSATRQAGESLVYMWGVVRRWWLLIAAAAMFAAAVAVLSISGQSTTFTATADLLVTQPNLTSPVGGNEIGNIDSLMPTFAEFTISDPVLNTAMSNLGIEDSVGSIRGSISVSRVPETLVLRVQVRRPNERESVELAAAVSESLIAQIGSVDPGGLPADIDIEARPIRQPQVSRSAPGGLRTLILALVLGVGFSTVVAFALDRS